MKNFKNLEKLSDIELIKQYSKIVSLMKERGLVKSRNMVGELGKHYAVEVYNESADLPNLQAIQRPLKTEGKVYFHELSSFKPLSLREPSPLT